MSWPPITPWEKAVYWIVGVSLAAWAAYLLLFK